MLLYASFPPREQLWWLAPLAFAALGVAVHGRRARAGFGYGYLFGVGFLGPLLIWVGEFVGPVATVPLVAFESLFLGLTGLGTAMVSRLPAAPLWAAGAWVAVEALRARVPFGGFPWGKVAFGSPDGAFLPLAALGGSPLVSFGVALTGFAAGALAVRLALGARGPRRLAVPAVLLVVAPVAALAAAPAVGTAAERRHVTVALVQGNVPRAGLDFNAQRRAVLDNHAERTRQLAADVAAGRVPQPELVIWPENASDIDPFRNPDAAAVIDGAVDAIGVPVLVGAVLRGEGRTGTNSALVWTPQRGPVDHYDKRRLQPFGEYVPAREFFRRFSSYVDAAGFFVAGGDDGILAPAGFPLGVLTCWEIAFDDTVAETVRNGAQLIAVPTNNATFGRTEMTYQQLGMSRLRAVEHSRSVLVAATSGVSAVVRPDGSVISRTGLFTPDALVEQVPLRTTTTLATRLGTGPEWAITALGLVGIGLAAIRLRRPGRPPASGEAR